MSWNRRDILKAAGKAGAGALAASALGGMERTAAATPTGSVPSNPRISEWAHAKSSSHEAGWTDQFQGMCTDGAYWYIVSNADDDQRLHKLSLDFRTTYASLSAPSGSGHIGAPTYDPQRRQIYVPVEGDEPELIWKVTTGLSTAGIVPIAGRTPGSHAPQRWKFPWMAFNPRDGLVYSSVFGDPERTDIDKEVDRIWGYDRDTGRLKKEIPLPSKVYAIQGGTFGNGGRNLYLASDYEEATNDRKHVYAYDFSSATDGVPVRTWGKVAVPDADDEVECVVFAHLSWHGARDTHISIGLLDDTVWSGATDNVYFRHLAVPSPNLI
ncbi:hypothetical protein [Streptomyces hygroscopicus]|uniref:hypothetical protein n=1 Tax=Streptomyces hygroscopicus TaxID=1912 RepID=UPI001FCB689D|nr:hypothetical protein [Streptomyces hygroscopicus]